ncbi:MAG: hypothetical protein IJP84_05165 [Lachnospiraceae bacterium]|nr:hypothetical protein [Lachnospiraceae bacterium]
MKDTGGKLGESRQNGFFCVERSVDMVKSKASYNVLKAISIGLAASIALMPTATAFADDGEGEVRKKKGGSLGSGVESSSSEEKHKKSSHSKKSEEARDEVQEAKDQAEQHFNEYHPDTEEHQGTINPVVDPVIADQPEGQNVVIPGQTGNENQQNTGNPSDNVSSHLGAAEDALNNIVADANAADNAIGDSDKDVETSGYIVVTDENGNQVVVADPTYNAQNDEDPYGDSNDFSGYVNGYVDRNLVDKENFDDGKNHVKGEFEAGKAAEAAGDAKDKTGDDKVTSGNTNDNVQKAAYDKAEDGTYRGMYDTQEESDAARASARDELGGIQNMLDEGQKKLDDAGEKLQTAKDSLDTAQGALDNAKKLAKDAETKEKEAKDAYEKLLLDLGPKGESWDYNEETGEYVVYDKVSNDSEMGKALSEMGTAYDNAHTHAETAKENVGKAEAIVVDAKEEVQEANAGAAQTIKDLTEVAREAAGDASNKFSGKGIYEEGKTDIKPSDLQTVKDKDGNTVKDEYGNDVYKVQASNADLDLLLEQIVQKRSEIEAVEDKTNYNNKNTVNNYLNDVRDIAKLMLEYTLAYEGATGIDANVATKVTGKNYFKVEYKDAAGNDCVKYFNYMVVKTANGNKGDWDKYNENSHVLLVEIDPATGKSNMLCSEFGLKNKLDAYQKEVEGQRSDLNDAVTNYNNADSLIGSINELDKLLTDDDGFSWNKSEDWSKQAETASEKAKAYGKDAENLQKEYDAQKKLVGDLQDLTTKIQALRTSISNGDYNYTDTSGKACKNNDARKPNRLLAYYLLQYSFIEEYSKYGEVEVGDFNPSNWSNPGNIDNNYGKFTITYTDADGVVHTDETVYFDYNAIYANGEIVNFSGNEYNSLKNNGIIDHIDVLVKTPAGAENVFDGTFSGKGSSTITDTQFGNDMTDADRKLENLRNQLTNAKNAEAYANLISEQASAKALEAKVAEAKEKVEAAKAALLDARKISSVNRELIAELEKKLQEAKDEYDAADKDYQEAGKNLEAVQTAYDEIKAAVDDYVNAFKVKEATESDPAPAPQPDPDPDPEPEPEPEPEPKPDKPGDVPGGRGGRGGNGGGDGTPAGGEGGAAGGGAGGGDITPTFFTADAPAGGPVGEIVAGGGGVFTDGGAIITAPGGDGGVLEEGAVDDGVLGERMAPEAPVVASQVLGDQMAPISRGSLFTEEGLKIPFMWWIIILILGAKGAQMYAESRKRKKAAVKEEIK